MLNEKRFDNSCKISPHEPATEDKNAGSASSDAKRTPRPSLDTGKVAWFQTASLKFTLSTACKVHRITWSYSSSITLPKQFALRKVYSNFGELKQFRRRNNASRAFSNWRRLAKR
jgi:hypothetical protein